MRLVARDLIVEFALFPVGQSTHLLIITTFVRFRSRAHRALFLINRLVDYGIFQAVTLRFAHWAMSGHIAV